MSYRAKFMNYISLIGLLIFLTITISCVMSQDLQTFKIEENRPIGTLIGRVHYANIYNDQLIYEFSNGFSKYVLLNNRTGDILTKIVLDVETMCPKLCENNEYAVVQMSVVVKKPKELLKMIKVSIVVTDIDDNDPLFPIKNITIKRKEVLYKKGMEIALPIAKDRDLLLRNRQMTYQLVGEQTEFVLDENRFQKPILRLLVDLDYERRQFYSMVLYAYPKNRERSSSNVQIVLQVVNINDCVPYFDKQVYELEIKEDFPLDKIYTKIVAIDNDGDKLDYHLEPVDSPFQVNEFGEVSLRAELDYEKRTRHNIVMVVSDGEFRAETKLNIDVTDVNDNRPEYTLSPNSLSLEETNRTKVFVGQITITDKDTNEVNHGLHCSIQDENQVLEFQPNRQDPSNHYVKSSLIYQLYTTRKIDREAITGKGLDKDVLYSYMMCYDNGKERQLYQNISVALLVKDVNDNYPQFKQTQYNIRFPENNIIGHNFIRVEATDADIGLNGLIRYSIQSMYRDYLKLFSIDPTTGWIKALQRLDREQHAEYKLTIIAQDSSPTDRKSSSCHVVITIDDENDNSPKLLKDMYLSVSENQPIGTYVGDLKSTDADAGQNAVVKYSLISNTNFHSYTLPQDLFQLYSNGSLYTTQIFDREKQDKYCIQVQLTDSSPFNPLTSRSPVCIMILDENDNYPVIYVYDSSKVRPILPSNLTSNVDYLITMSIREEPGFIVAQIRAEDADQSNKPGQLKYFMEPTVLPASDDNDLPQAPSLHLQSSMFTIDNDDGVISLRKSLTRDHLARYVYKIVVQDSGKPVLRTAKTISIEILDIPAYSKRFASVYNDGIGNRGGRNNPFLSKSNMPDSIIKLSGSNLMIAIILSIVSALLIVFLVIAIVCVVRPCTKCHCNSSHSSNNNTTSSGFMSCYQRSTNRHQHSTSHCQNAVPSNIPPLIFCDNNNQQQQQQQMLLANHNLQQPHEYFFNPDKIQIHNNEYPGFLNPPLDSEINSSSSVLPINCSGNNYGEFLRTNLLVKPDENLEKDWTNSLITRTGDNTTEDIYLTNFYRHSDVNYTTSPMYYSMQNSSTNQVRALRNDEQRSDSGKGASDDDVAYFPRQQMISSDIKINNDIYSSNYPSIESNYNSYCISQPFQIQPFFSCLVSSSTSATRSSIAGASTSSPTTQSNFYNIPQQYSISARTPSTTSSQVCFVSSSTMDVIPSSTIIIAGTSPSSNHQLTTNI